MNNSRLNSSVKNSTKITYNEFINSGMSIADCLPDILEIRNNSLYISTDFENAFYNSFNRLYKVFEVLPNFEEITDELNRLSSFMNSLKRGLDLTDNLIKSFNIEVCYILDSHYNYCKNFIREDVRMIEVIKEVNKDVLVLNILGEVLEFIQDVWDSIQKDFTDVPIIESNKSELHSSNVFNTESSMDSTDSVPGSIDTPTLFNVDNDHVDKYEKYIDIFNRRVANLSINNNQSIEMFEGSTVSIVKEKINTWILDNCNKYSITNTSLAYGKGTWVMTVILKEI